MTNFTKILKKYKKAFLEEDIEGRLCVIIIAILPFTTYFIARNWCGVITFFSLAYFLGVFPW